MAPDVAASRIGIGYNTEAMRRELHRVLNVVLAAAAVTALVLAKTIL